MSSARLLPTTSADTRRPVDSTRVTSSAPATTWWLVSTCPRSSMITPDPLPRSARTWTTLGRIVWAAASTLPAGDAPAPAVPSRDCTIVGSDPPVCCSASAVPAPETPPASRATTTSEVSPRRPGRGAGEGGCGAGGAGVAQPGGAGVATVDGGGAAGGGGGRCAPADPRSGGRADAGVGVVHGHLLGSVEMGQMRRENQRRDSAPAPTLISRARAARYGVTSRCSVRQPMEEPMSA